MSERLHQHSEQSTNSHEQLVSKEHQQRTQELAIENARQALKKHAEQDPQKLAQEAFRHAEESDKQTIHASPRSEHDSNQALPGVHQSIKNNAYRRELTKIQAKLPGKSRTLSKIIHNKTVETVSNIGAETVARPSGLLGGSIAAFIGSFLTYYTARHYGFRYNYLVLFLLFVAGFLIGSALELGLWSVSKRRKQY